MNSSSRLARTARRARSRLCASRRQEEHVYFAFAAIYVVLSVVFIADVLRQPSTALSRRGEGALDRRAARRARLRLDRVRDLAHAAEPRAGRPLGKRDADRPQPGHRGADRRARAGRGGGGGRGGRTREGCVPGVERRRAGRSWATPAQAGDARRGKRRGTRTDRVAERRQANRGGAWRDRDGRAGVPLLRRRRRQARR